MLSLRQDLSSTRPFAQSTRPAALKSMNYPKEGWTEYALMALVALTALWISLGSLQHCQNADSIVPVLVSLQHWTPFYWEANRWGMLVPLLAKPFHDPLGNLIVQTGLDTFAALAASFLLLRYFFPNSRMWIAAAALQNVWLFLLVPKPIQFDWLVGQCYGVSLAVGLAGLILLDKRRWLIGACAYSPGSLGEFCRIPLVNSIGGHTRVDGAKQEYIPVVRRLRRRGGDHRLFPDGDDAFPYRRSRSESRWDVDNGVAGAGTADLGKHGIASCASTVDDHSSCCRARRSGFGSQTAKGFIAGSRGSDRDGAPILAYGGNAALGTGERIYWRATFILRSF